MNRLKLGHKFSSELSDFEVSIDVVRVEMPLECVEAPQLRKN